MSNCSSCASKENCNKEQCGKVLPKYGKIYKIIGVISGKGGVGKSTITGILAVELSKKGFKVGVLDGDITGPSMPRILGISEKRAEAIGETDKVQFKPVESKEGIKVISLNLLIEDEEQPVIWRGPVITGVLNQMYADTLWGDLDFLLIDMPPGTGDIALTVMQSIPLNGMVIVSTPQEMVSMIVKKVIIMAGKLNIPIVGVVENMSYVLCGNCGERTNIFSNKSAAEEANFLKVPLLFEMPVDLEMTRNLSEGSLENYIFNNSFYDKMIENFLHLLENQ